MNVLKARGRKVVAGRTIGRMLVLAGIAAALKGRTGCTGVANPGEDDGIGFSGAGVGGGLNIGAARGFSG